MLDRLFFTIVLIFTSLLINSQTICRDTNCIEFKNAIEEGNIPEKYTGYVIFRYKLISGKKTHYLDSTISPSRLKYPENLINLKDPILELETFKAGQIKSIVSCINGKQSLKYSFHDNGNTRYIHYLYEILDTKSDVDLPFNSFPPLVYYYKNGGLEQLNYLQNGYSDVIKISYYPNQTIKYKAPFISGKLHGMVYTYFDNGKIEKVCSAKNGLLSGFCLTYDKKGSLIQTQFFNDNKMVENVDMNQYKSQFFIIKLLAEEENKNVDRKGELLQNIENLRKTEAEKKLKEEELKHQEEEIKRKQLELELLVKDKAVSNLTIKAKEAELLKNRLLANEKRKEIENLNQQKTIHELTIKNNEVEIVQKNIETKNNQKLITRLEKEKELSQQNLKQQKIIQKLILTGSGLLLIFLIFVFFSLYNSRKTNKLIEKQKELSESQKHVIEEKQNEIIESITYAKRIQEAILPPEQFINKFIPSNFIFYKPKDIVAGDFYWAEKVGDLFFIAAADSTGHGVPGAMVSVVCSNALNRAVKEFNLKETGKILDKTRELVLETFEKSSNEVKDGMDISLLCIEEKKGNVFWSGANNPLWYIQENELKEIKADKQSIGKTDNPKAFTTHQINHKQSATFYLFTDGFADQFGGEKGKKFKYKQFAELLFTNSYFPLKQQSENITKAFEDWKGDLEQVDDVCVIGIKL